MADNTRLNTGTGGDLIATDDIVGGVAKANVDGVSGVTINDFIVHWDTYGN